MVIYFLLTTLGDINEKKHKQVHTLEAEQDGGEDTEQKDEQADAYQHVKEANKDDIQVDITNITYVMLQYCLKKKKELM